MKLTRISALLAGMFAVAVSLVAQPAPIGLKKIGISDVKPNKALVASATKNNTGNSLDRVAQAMDSQLIDRVQNTRKFEVIARSDLASVLTENNFTGANFKVSGVDYLLVTTIDDFQDFTETRKFGSMGVTATVRVIRFGAVGKIYDAGSGKLIESANFPLEIRDQEEQGTNATKNGELSDKLLQAITREMAEKIANRVADVVYPAKVLSKLDKQVTFSRGEGSGVALGQVWVVYALGQELTDPDTGASLGREELQVGKVRVTRIAPKFSVGEAIEDSGIDRGAVLRLPPESAQ